MNKPNKSTNSSASHSPHWTDREIRAAKQDTLHFKQYCQVLTDIIHEADTPLTIGIFGPWGSGKTSLMRLVEEKIKQVSPDSSPVEIPPIVAPLTVWFNAWKYDQEEALWRALVIQVLNAFRPASAAPSTAEADSPRPDTYLPELAAKKKAREALNQRLDDLEASLYHTVEREEVGGVTIDWDKLLKGSVMGITHLSLSALPGIGSVLGEMIEKAQEQITGKDLTTIFEAIQRERHKVYRQHIQSLEQFQQAFEKLVKTEILDKNRQLVVFIDDLDRCLPEKAIEVLEALKLFLDVPGCIFFLGADREVIQKGIRVKYQGFLVDSDDPEAAKRRIPISGDNYLEKIVQLPFHLLPLDKERVKAFIEKSGVALPSGCADIFAAGLEANPRKVKRTLNIFRLLHQLAHIRQDEFSVEIKPQLLAKVVVIQSRYNELYNHLVEAPALLSDLEHYFAETSVDSPVSSETTNAVGGLSGPGYGQEQRNTSLDGQTLLEKYWRLRPLRHLLTCGDERFSNLPLAEVKLYLYLTYTTAENPQSAAAEAVATRWWSDLLSNDLSRIKSVVAAIEEEDKSTLTEFLQGLQQLVETPSSQYNLPQRFSASTALALLGDRRNFEEMISIPPGLYGPEGETEHLDGFKISKYPVTNLQYKKFLAENPKHSPPNHWGSSTYPPELANHPVTNISWDDAQAYCGWAGKYLPSIQQWMAASQGLVNQTPLDVDKLGKIANFAQMNLNSTSPVGIFPDSATLLGGLDMAGNVWEWTQTPKDGEYALKGGAWNVPATKTIITDYWSNHANATSPTIGFRVAE